ncbi:hypothetical protein HanRHA438_Chr15g0734741 [Helianthus annuus]|nr:hypothetical protein HanRHA438_Chr15g0734741 [Helianthus annuus]
MHHIACRKLQTTKASPLQRGVRCLSLLRCDYGVPGIFACLKVHKLCSHSCQFFLWVASSAHFLISRWIWVVLNL